MEMTTMLRVRRTGVVAGICTAMLLSCCASDGAGRTQGNNTP